MKHKRAIFLILLVTAALITSGCSIVERITNELPERIAGSGNVVQETREVSGFDKLLISGFGRVIITQGDEESLTIETDDNLMPYIRVAVVDGTLELGFTEDLDKQIVDPSENITFRVGVQELAEVTLSGAAQVVSDGLKVEELSLSLDGAGDIELAGLDTTDVRVFSSGAGLMNLAGETDNLRIELDGLGGIDAGDLRASAAVVIVDGLGSVTVWAVDTLDVDISGAGGVDYYGDPSISPEISGVGRLNSLGSK